MKPACGSRFTTLGSPQPSQRGGLRPVNSILGGDSNPAIYNPCVLLLSRNNNRKYSHFITYAIRLRDLNYIIVENGTNLILMIYQHFVQKRYFLSRKHKVQITKSKVLQATYVMFYRISYADVIIGADHDSCVEN